jgi:hypothetical protein
VGAVPVRWVGAPHRGSTGGHDAAHARHRPAGPRKYRRHGCRELGGTPRRSRRVTAIHRIVFSVWRHGVRHLLCRPWTRVRGPRRQPDEPCRRRIPRPGKPRTVAIRDPLGRSRDDHVSRRRRVRPGRPAHASAVSRAVVPRVHLWPAAGGPNRAGASNHPLAGGSGCESFSRAKLRARGQQRTVPAARRYRTRAHAIVIRIAAAVRLSGG